MVARLAPVRVTVAYAMVLAVVGVTLLALGPHVQHTVISHLSTNLHNLAQGHLGTLVGSAFVTEGTISMSASRGWCACWRWGSWFGAAGG